ncbi:cytochrome P450 [Favolaschia claudopus]|uniref:Cytochrome P450 n=1 Tax=Favolaschia claudopus TaxID=2862362 RepID=A0AAW0E9V9_9AGAR
MTILDISTSLAVGSAITLLFLLFTTTTIPAALGGSNIFTYHLAALRLLWNGADVIQRGYTEYRDGLYRIPKLYRWDYVANGKKRIAEVADAPEDVLSFNYGVEDIIQADYTIGHKMTSYPHNATVVRAGLTRNLGRCFPQVMDEIIHAFDDVLALEDEDWKLIQVMPATMQIVARTSNRVFVGLPLCRDQKYLDLILNYTVTVFTRGTLIGLLPSFLKPILGPLISTRKSSLRHALKFLQPLIDERLAKDDECGSDWPGRPHDLVSWLIDVAEGEERTTSALTLRVLATNMAAIHNTSMTLTSALFDLTAHPEYISPLRDEVERVITEQGWSKSSLGSMHQLDSFIRESQRLTGTAPGQYNHAYRGSAQGRSVQMPRKVVGKDGFTFSDGLTIPRGSYLTVSAIPVQYDISNYEHPNEFDGFRFSRMRNDNTGESVFTRHMVSTGTDHLVFGHGRHACPGRFFAATEIKAMLAYILINYDVRSETEGVRPPEQCWGLLRWPNPWGKVLIRKRRGRQFGETK